MMDFIAQKLASSKNAWGANTLTSNSDLKRSINSGFTFGGLSLRNLVVLVGLAAMSWLCADAVSSQSLWIPPLIPTRGQLVTQSFFAPESWAQRELTALDGWDGDNPRRLADVNGDKRQDIVGFGNDGVWFAMSTGTSFSPAYVLPEFGYNQGWRTYEHERLTGDINGDGLEDVVGFGDAGVYRALSTGSGLRPAAFVVANYGYNQSWRVEKHVRLLADVNGDGRKDIVAFGTAGVWLSLATANGFFTTPDFVVANFGYDQGWTTAEHIRTTADVNGDGRQDIVAFGDAGVWIALSTGTGFEASKFVLADFGHATSGWATLATIHPRLLVDINRDKKADIVGFNQDGVWIARSTGNDFEAPQLILPELSSIPYTTTVTHPRFVVDLNGDGYQDILVFGRGEIARSLGGPSGFGTARPVLRDFIGDNYPSGLKFVGDVNGDGKQDLVAFSRSNINVARSNDLAPPPPPAAPSHPRVTGSTVTSLSIAWNDNSSNERAFYVFYNEKNADDNPKRVTIDPNDTTHVLSSLASNTEYCFTIQAENLFGVSAQTYRVCGRTKASAPQPTPTPQPTPAQGFNSVNVFNCNVNQGPVHLWTLDVAQGVWVQRGTLAAQYTSGSCPGTSTPLTVPLQDGHTDWLVAVDPQLPACGVNNPAFSACQRSLLGPLKGNAKGLALRHVVN